MSATMWHVYFFAVGAAIGSFLNVCIARWPLEQSVIRPPSHCPTCGQPIRWYDNVPIFAWLFLRGRCRNCGSRISIMYPAIELLVALGWLASSLAFGPTFTAIRVAVFGTVMLGVLATDFKHYLIPDGFTVFGLGFVLVTSVVSAFRGEATIFAGPGDAIIGACAGAGVIRIVGWLGEIILKREAMGFGDETLMAVVGAALGPQRALLVLFLGAAAGALVFALVVYPAVRLRGAQAQEQIELGLSKDSRGALPLVPFGVFLAPMAVVALVWGQSLIQWYVGHVLAVS